jgi:hypothetical protein
MEVMKFEGTQIAERFGDCQDLATIIKKVEDDAQVDGKVLCGITVNGIRIHERDEARIGMSALGSLNALEFQFDRPEDIYASSVTGIRELIENLSVRSVKGAEIFRSNDHSKAGSTFMNIIDTMQFLLDAITTLKPYFAQKNPDMMVKWNNSEIHMINTFHEIFNAYEGKDYVLLSDVLEYELYNNLSQWREVFSV